MHADKRRFLQNQIDLIAVPVFIADECVDDQFRIAAINAAHARLTGLDDVQARGRTPHEVIANASGVAEVVSQCRNCIKTDAPISYRETVAYRGTPMVFDTKLQKIPRTNSRSFRIVGTAAKTEDRQHVGADIGFYVSLARNAIMTIEMLMTARLGGGPMSDFEHEATLILCRKALLSLDDITSAAERIVGSERSNDTVMAEAMRDIRLH